MPTPPGDQSHPNRNPSTTPARTRHGREPQPWLLPFQHLPVVLQDHGIAEAHVRPLVGRRLEDDSIRCWRTSPARAWRQALVEWSRTGMSFVALAFDIDSRLSLEHLAAREYGSFGHHPDPEHRDLPQGQRARPRDLHAPAPGPPRAEDYDTRWLRTKAYSLAELRAYIPHGWRRPAVPRTDAGRNDALFRALMR